MLLPKFILLGLHEKNNSNKDFGLNMQRCFCASREQILLQRIPDGFYRTNGSCLQKKTGEKMLHLHTIDFMSIQILCEREVDCTDLLKGQTESPQAVRGLDLKWSSSFEEQEWFSKAAVYL